MHEHKSVILNRIIPQLPHLTTNYLDCIDQYLKSGKKGYDSLAEILGYDPESRVPLCLSQIFLPIIRLLFEVICFFETKAHENFVAKAVERLSTQIPTIDGINQDESIETSFSVAVVKREFLRVESMVSKAREALGLGSLRAAKITSRKEQQRKTIRMPNHPWSSLNFSTGLRPPGDPNPLHDNDFEDICRIKIIPTLQEILTTGQPSLPGNFQDHVEAHWLPIGAKRLFDTHFRLLREDLWRPIRDNILGYLNYRIKKEIRKSVVLKDGRLRGSITFMTPNGQKESQIDLNVYTDVFLRGFQITPGRNRQLCAEIIFNGPGHLDNKNNNERREFWEKTDRLAFGGLVAIISKYRNTPDIGSFSIALGVVVDRKIDRLLGKGNKKCQILVQISEHYLTHNFLSQQNDGTQVLVEANKILFESYRPILETLQKATPDSLPLMRYLCPDPQNTNDNMAIDSPIFTHTPYFRFDLTSLCTDKQTKLFFEPTSVLSKIKARKELLCRSSLDEDQAKAVITALSSELSCIQGPPGTGKSYVGVQIMRVLLENKKLSSPNEPILLVCFTNHALDQFIEHILDAGYSKIVRMGGRSRVERIQALSLQNISSPGSVTNKSVPKATYQELEQCEKRLEVINCRLSDEKVHWPDLESYLFIRNFKQYTDLENCYISLKNEKETDEAEGFQRQARKKQSAIDVIQFWIDHDALESVGKGLHKDVSEKVDNRFYVLHDEYRTEKKRGSNASREKNSRTKSELLDCENIWSLTREEKIRLLSYWKEELPRATNQELIDIQKEIDFLNKRLNNFYDDEKVTVLKSHDIVAVTTTGAAKYKGLLESVAPKIIIAEEAGEILEAHILSCLHPDVQQMILIGDHKQLRPRVACYELSSESKEGARYRLDVSLFERLQTSSIPFPLVTLSQQRRMRPEIADFVRTCIYPNLRDSESVKEYPPVRGVRKNIFFIEHSKPEDSSPNFEVDYVVGLIQYLLRQNVYSPSDIVILTPYVGQLLKIRDRLGKVMMVFVSEKDVQTLRNEGVDEEALGEAAGAAGEAGRIYGASGNTFKVLAEEKLLSKSVRVSTVDNYQGEESKIVIISLVRSRSSESDRGTIGFLGVSNRVNVLLSRAQHGLFLVGNSNLLVEKSEIWSQVIDIFGQKDSIGTGLPIFCERHPDISHFISQAQQFSNLAPDGGCTRPCLVKLPDCGHVCPFKCHSDFENHRGIFCHEACPRLHDECDHTCEKRCGDECGECPEEMWTVSRNDKNPKAVCGSWLVLLSVFKEPSMPTYLAATQAAVISAVNLASHVSIHDDVKKQRVDLIMFMTYEEIDLDEDPVVILPCGHLFSKSTLDGQVGMNLVYHYDEPSEHWTLSQLPQDFIELPVCSSCRGSLSSVYRYRRLYNFATLCVAEKVWIEKVHAMLQKYDSVLGISCLEAAEASNQLRSLPESWSPKKGESWRVEKMVNEALAPLTGLQKGLELLVSFCKRSPRRQAYEASLSSLVHTFERPEAISMLQKSAYPPNAAFERQAVNLLCICLEKIGVIWELGSRASDSPTFRQSAYNNIAEALSKCEDCLNRCRKEILEFSENMLELRFFKLRFIRLEWQKRHGLKKDNEASFLNSVDKLKMDWGGFRHARVLASFADKHAQTLDEYEEGLRTLGMLKFYSEVSHEEIQSVMEGLHSELQGIQGHWYTCANGHPYAIGECGGAMQISTCPECGAEVGGSSHVLAAGNRIFSV
ncbi:hypothetical protein HDU67_006823 [Dinochytrium kinnereticum]|nr:hypothetical protein HDU67_006823 [Dinochytrium kinnereticum]